MKTHLGNGIDGNVYIWNKEQVRLIEVLPGHTGTVNSVSWNSKNSQMFASASDDCSVRMYVHWKVIFLTPSAGEKSRDKWNIV